MELDEYGYSDWDAEENGRDNGPADHTAGPLHEYQWHEEVAPEKEGE